MSTISEVRPDIALNWDYQSNGNASPSNVDINSTEKYRFTCIKCKRSWVSSPIYMKVMKACPYCFLNKPKYNNSLQDEYPEVAKEWYQEGNNPITPKDILPKSNRVYWWKCPKGHIYSKQAVSRTLAKENCPYCASRRIQSGDNDLQSNRPDLMKEWDWEKNDKLGIKPNQLSVHSHTMVWWKCVRGHSWKTTPGRRTHSNGSNCPYCNSPGTSYPEQYLYWSLKQLFPNTRNRFKTTTNIEYDIYVPEIGLCIEYSGINWHVGKQDYDEMKRKVATEGNKTFIQICGDERFKGTIDFTNHLITINPTKGIDLILQQVLSVILSKFGESIDNIDFNKVKENATLYSKGSIEYEDSLEYKSPELAKEFDTEKNKIKPSEVKAGSNKKYWWKCSKCNYGWQSTPANRKYNKSGCPNCRSIKRHSIIYLEDKDKFFRR